MLFSGPILPENGWLYVKTLENYTGCNKINMSPIRIIRYKRLYFEPYNLTIQK